MKVIEIFRGGKAIAENCKKHIELWEGMDGLHPIDERSIFRDVDGLEEPHLIIFEGDLVPYGIDSGMEAANNVSTIVLQSKFAGVPLKNISTKWGRLMAKLLKFLPFILIAVGVIMLILLYLGGYFDQFTG